MIQKVHKEIYFTNFMNFLKSPFWLNRSV